MLKPKDQIGPYTLISRLGRGGYGIVWLAEQRTRFSAKEFAVKVLSDPDPDLEALSQEAKLWVKASGHPNVLPIIVADEYDGYAVIVSEYAPDGSLGEWLKKNGGTAPSIERAVRMACGILNGLEHLHSKGIVHRDLKPENILLQDETPRLADFGLARAQGRSAQSSGLKGTLSYTAPEVVKQQPIIVQNDIWSAGVVFHQLLSGHMPFPQTDPASLVLAITRRKPDPLPPSIPDPLRQVVARALQKDPALRYQSAVEMREDLQSALLKPQAKPPDPIKQPSELQPNDKIGPYTLIEELGSGSYGIVWLAERRGKYAATKAAVKIVLDENSDHAAIANESQLWAQAGGHPNVLSIIEADYYDGQSIIVSEYAPDGSLEDWLIKQGGRAPSIGSAVSMISGILAGLGHLHSKKIVHRDLKPANIMLQGDTPRLADFGLSRVLHSGPHSGGIVGTYEYMSPEAFVGERSERSDLWSVGVMFYRLLAAKLPFNGKALDKLIKSIRNDEPAPLLSWVPDQLQKTVFKALRKKPEERYQSAVEMLKDIQAAFALKPPYIAEGPTAPLAENVKPSPRPAGAVEDLPESSVGQFVPIPAGEFMMGSNGYDDEKPVHRVRISRSFEMGKYTVTQSQWEAVMGSNLSRFKGANLPVETVSWEDAQKFIQRLNDKSKKYNYRLPTEAEWEYACRAGSTGDYAGRLEQMAWCSGNSDRKTHPVGQKQPNAWGLYDMHGNVWEWCQDWYDGNYYKQSPDTDPQGLSSGSYRVLRGGSWSGLAGYCRSAVRFRYEPGRRINYLGFRLLRTAR